MISLPPDNGKTTTVESMSELINAVKKAKDEWKDTGGHIIIKKSQIDDPSPFEDDLIFDKPLVIRANNIGECTIGGTGQIAFNNARNVWLYGINFKNNLKSKGKIEDCRREKNDWNDELNAVEFKDCKNCVIAGCDFQPTSTTLRWDDDEEERKCYPWYNYLGIAGGDCNYVGYNKFHDKQPSRGQFLWISGSGGTRGTVIEYNHFKNHPGIENSKKNLDKGEAIQMGNSTLGSKVFGSIVRYNLFEECKGDAECVTNKSSCNIYHHNTFRNNRGSLVLRHGMYNIVRDNIFLGRHNGIRVYGKQIVKKNYLKSEKKLDANIVCPLVIGNGANVKEKNDASYVQVKGSRIEKNDIVVNSPENDENAIIVIWGYGGRDLKPQENTFVENRVLAKSGTILKLNNDATRESNDFLNNILYNDGSAKYGDIITRDGSSDQCRPPGDKPQIAEPNALQETDVGRDSTRSDQPYSSREELNEVIEFSEGDFKNQLESLVDDCS